MRGEIGERFAVEKGRGGRREFVCFAFVEGGERGGEERERERERKERGERGRGGWRGRQRGKKKEGEGGKGEARKGGAKTEGEREGEKERGSERKRESASAGQCPLSAVLGPHLAWPQHPLSRHGGGRRASAALERRGHGPTGGR